jgi:YgiT-type zinc finger domain-containing protein
MRCLHCPTGETGPGTKTATLERGSTIVIVRSVPATVCDTCGEATYSAEITDELLRLLDEAVARGIELLVQPFEAPRAHVRRDDQDAAARVTRTH